MRIRLGEKRNKNNVCMGEIKSSSGKKRKDEIKTQEKKMLYFKEQKHDILSPGLIYHDFAFQLNTTET